MIPRQPHEARLLLAAIAAAVCLQPGCRSLTALPGQRLDLQDAAQGRPDDFSKKITSHLFESGMMVGVGNDDRNLYVFFSPDIRHARRPPGRARLFLWIDGQGGTARKLGLEHASGPIVQETPPGGPGPDAGGNFEEKLLARPVSPPGAGAQELLKVIDRQGGKEAFISADGSQGPAVRLASDWGDFAYQLRIPIQGSGDWPGLGIRPGQAFSIGLMWKFEALPAAGKKQFPGGRPGGPGGRGPGGGPGMGGAPPDMEGGPGIGRPGEKPATKRKIWLKAVLAER